MTDDGTSSVTPPSTTSFNPGAASAFIAGCTGTYALEWTRELNYPDALIASFSDEGAQKDPEWKLLLNRLAQQWSLTSTAVEEATPMSTFRLLM